MLIHNTRDIGGKLLSIRKKAGLTQSELVDDDLERAMIEVGYRTIFYETYELPNGKCLIRMDFQK